MGIINIVKEYSYNLCNGFTPSVKLDDGKITKWRDNDAVVLAALASDMRVMYGRNGIKYWYYFFNNIHDRKMVHFIFNMNRIYPKFHYSGFESHGRVRPSFRIRYVSILTNPSTKDFIQNVQENFIRPQYTISDIQHTLRIQRYTQLQK